MNYYNELHDIINEKAHLEYLLPISQGNDTLCKQHQERIAEIEKLIPEYEIRSEMQKLDRRITEFGYLKNRYKSEKTEMVAVMEIYNELKQKLTKLQFNKESIVKVTE